MSDIFDEVGEDLRREQLKRLWQRYNGFIIGAAVLIVAGTAGYRGYETYTNSRNQAAGTAYEAAIKAAASEEPAKAAEALVAFASDAPKIYSLLARFRAASENAKAGAKDNALAAFDAISNDGTAPVEMRDAARIRAAMIAVDKEDLAAMKARLSSLDSDISPWRFSARELIALSAMKAKAYDDVRSFLAKLNEDPETPQEFRTRAQILEAVLTSEAGPGKTEGNS